MSEETAAAEHAEVETPAPTPEPPEGRAGRDAAKYRTRLRETEAERDKLQMQVITQQDQQIYGTLCSPMEITLDSGQAGDGQRGYMVTPGKDGTNTANVSLRHAMDLFTLGNVSREDLINEDGTINQEKLHNAARDLLRARPELFIDNLTPAPARYVVPTIGQEPSGPPPQAPGWQQVLQDAARQHNR